MRGYAILALTLVTACSKSSPPDGTQAVPSSSVVAATPSAVAPAVQAGAWYVGRWKGEFSAAKHTPTTTTKEGAPAAWEKDDGKKLSGPASIELVVDASGLVGGTIQGALGELGLSGTVNGEDLRAKLNAKADDPTAIHNGYLTLVHEGNALKGKLTAATGDALTLRQAEVTLSKVAP